MSDYSELKRLAGEVDRAEWYETEGGAVVALNYKDACFIEALSPSVVLALIAENEALLTALKGMTAMYGYCWDLVDGGLICMQDDVQRFEEAHEAAQKVVASMVKG